MADIPIIPPILVQVVFENANRIKARLGSPRKIDRRLFQRTVKNSSFGNIVCLDIPVLSYIGGKNFLTLGFLANLNSKSINRMAKSPTPWPG
jgi:hypothetical protein